jgi:hypothetical protein
MSELNHYSETPGQGSGEQKVTFNGSEKPDSPWQIAEMLPIHYSQNFLSMMTGDLEEYRRLHSETESIIKDKFVIEQRNLEMQHS